MSRKSDGLLDIIGNAMKQKGKLRDQLAVAQEEIAALTRERDALAAGLFCVTLISFRESETREGGWRDGFMRAVELVNQNARKKLAELASGELRKP